MKPSKQISAAPLVKQSSTSNESKSSQNDNSTVAYSPFAISHNNHLVEYCRTSMSALAGSTAGIIGLTSLQGFAFYLLMVLILWVMLSMKAGTNWNSYFTSRWNVLTNGFLGGLTTYVLFWTFLYGMVHVY